MKQVFDTNEGNFNTTSEIVPDKDLKKNPFSNSILPVGPRDSVFNEPNDSLVNKAKESFGNVNKYSKESFGNVNKYSKESFGNVNKISKESFSSWNPFKDWNFFKPITELFDKIGDWCLWIIILVVVLMVLK
jgi:hypothetical protein